MSLNRSGTTFVLGGARSGKSAHAERLIIDSGLEAVYVATGRSFDQEMDERIRQHKQRRGGSWRTIEEPLALVDVLQEQSGEDRAVLVDCLTLWVTNLMMEERDVDAEALQLADCLGGLGGAIVLVSNEVGLGIVPENRMAREFRDHAGRLHQMIAEKADEVYLIAAGLPLKMKG
ncbi:bifunctional adenosylcobinamide kinase/adenosylcobinamide-phosphate guanylyltransferase [Hoeflea sp. TYP-13]|uniref:bifunctional adenosylcobinamide kinase/adenosylcobinamide-phosphate guanylyltransferase n=1 Tax=Hoeflea sp. TYP-13 TaxID=3230023 RepID=UPI0034C6A9BD